MSFEADILAYCFGYFFKKLGDFHQKKSDHPASGYRLRYQHWHSFGLYWDAVTRHRLILKGMYNCTIDLLFDRFGLACFANKNKNCQLSYS
jgi:hypothetical protein